MKKSFLVLAMFGVLASLASCGDVKVSTASSVAASSSTTASSSVAASSKASSSVASSAASSSAASSSTASSSVESSSVSSTVSSSEAPSSSSVTSSSEEVSSVDPYAKYDTEKVLNLTTLATDFAAKGGSGTTALAANTEITDGFFTGVGINVNAGVIKTAGCSDVAGGKYFVKFTTTGAGVISNLKIKSASSSKTRNFYLAKANDSGFDVLAKQVLDFNTETTKAIWYYPVWNLPTAGTYYLLGSGNCQIAEMTVKYDSAGTIVGEPNDLTVTPADNDTINAMELYPMKIANGYKVGNYTFASAGSSVMMGGEYNLSSTDATAISSQFVDLAANDTISLTTTDFGTFTVIADTDLDTTATPVSLKVTDAAGTVVKEMTITKPTDKNLNVADSFLFTFNTSAAGTFTFTATGETKIYSLKFAL